MCATRSSTTAPWSRQLEAQGAVFVEELRRGAGGRARWCSPPTACRNRCPAEAERRNLLYLDATCPLVSKVHREAERHFADGGPEQPAHPDDRPCRPSRGGRHDGPAAAGRDDPGAGRRGGAAACSPPTRAGSPSSPRPRCRSTTPPRSSPCCATRFPDDRGAEARGHLLRHHQPAGGGQGDRAGLRPGDRDRQPEQQQLAAPARSGRARRRRAARSCCRGPTQLDWSVLDGVRTLGLTAGASAPEVAGAGDAAAGSASATRSTIEERRVTQEDVIFKLPAPLVRLTGASGTADGGLHRGLRRGAGRVPGRVRHRHAGGLPRHRRGGREQQLLAAHHAPATSS